MTDAEIVATAQFVSPRGATTDRNERATMEFAIRVAKMAGKQLHLVTWPTGQLVLADGNPHDPLTWTPLIVNAYRAAEAGVRGPVSIEVTL